MRIGRTIPPAASPYGWKDILSGFGGLVRAERELERFAAELKAFFSKRHCFLFDSGRAALALALVSLHKVAPERNRVLIPAFTCYSVPAAIVSAGLEPVLCDIKPASFDFNEEQLAKHLDDKKLLCIVPTHLFGCPASIVKLRRMTQGLNVPIVEDAAQALGASNGGVPLGTEGDIGIFSLGRGKALTTVSGGILVTDNDQYARKIERLCEGIVGGGLLYSGRLAASSIALKIFLSPALYWLPAGLPFLNLGKTIYEPGFPIRNYDGVQAGMSRNWQERLSVAKEKRRQNSMVWAGLPKHGRCRPYLETGDLPDLVRFPVVCDDASARTELLERSESSGLGLAAAYPGAICDIPALDLNPDQGAYPVARWLSQTLMTLPVHPLLTAEDRSRILELIGSTGQSVFNDNPGAYVKEQVT